MLPHCLRAPEVQGDGKTTEQHFSVIKEKPPVVFRDIPSSSFPPLLTSAKEEEIKPFITPTVLSENKEDFLNAQSFPWTEIKPEA